MVVVGLVVVVVVVGLVVVVVVDVVGLVVVVVVTPKSLSQSVSQQSSPEEQSRY